MNVSGQEYGTGESVFSQLGQLFSVLARSRARRALSLFGISLTAVIAVTAVVQVWLNTWQGSIYDAIATRELSVFMRELGVFAVIASVLLCLGVAQTWLHEMLKIRLREAVTRDLMKEWLKPMRAYRLPLAGEIGANPDQRMQEDTRRLSDLTADLAVGLVQSSLMLLAFAGVLWALSAHVVFEYSGERFAVPGYMVWCALIYAALGSFLTWLAGRPLIRAHSNLRAEEANFRFDLVHVNESSEMIAVQGGERVERRFLGQALETVLALMRRIAWGVARVTWVTSAHGWLGIVAPIALAAPGYFGKTLSLGDLMMVVGAFYQVQQALRWYIERFPVIAEWRAMLSRSLGYRGVLRRAESLGAGEQHIVYAKHETGKLSIDGLSVAGPSGQIKLSERHVEIAPGERVLIAGPMKSGKSVLFRALAGVWIWGHGTIRLPPRETMMFLPQTPYVPLGTLRTALAYPAPPGRFDDAAMRTALARVRLGHLEQLLDRVRRWDKRLSAEEQHRLMLARLLLHKPAWIVQDLAATELDEENRRLAASVFERELQGATIINFGRGDALDHLYDRVLNVRTGAPRLALPLRLGADAATARETHRATAAGAKAADQPKAPAVLEAAGEES